jgi:hypothetical protein
LEEIDIYHGHNLESFVKANEYLQEALESLGKLEVMVSRNVDVAIDSPLPFVGPQRESSQEGSQERETSD